MYFKKAEDISTEEKSGQEEMSAYCCMYCLKDVSKYNLDFTRDIVCGECTQRLVGTKNIPQKRSHKPATARKVRSAGKIKGKSSNGGDKNG